MKHILAIATLTLLSFTQALAAEPLLQSGTSWDGGAIAYPEGEAEITSIILELEEGVMPRFHCHPVPTMGYVTKGSVKVETLDGKTTILNEGESLVEVMNTVHRGHGVDGAAQIVVFYAGAKGLPTTVFPDSENASEYCSP